MKSKKITLSKNELITLVRSAIEGWPRETAGKIYGDVDRNSAEITHAYPITIAKKRGLRSFSFSDAARNRISAFDRAIGKKKPSASLIGEYHSHPVKGQHAYMDKDYNLNILSREDIINSQNEMAKHDMPSWIEVLMRVKEVNYKRPQKIGHTINIKKNKVHFISRQHPKSESTSIGYDIMIMAYQVNRNPEHAKSTGKATSGKRRNYGVKQIPIRLSR